MNPETYNQFLRFKNKEFLTENELNLADDYIYGFLLCDYDHLEMYPYSNCIKVSYCFKIQKRE